MGGSLLWAGVSPQNGRWVPWGDGQGEKQPSEVALTSPGVRGKTRPLCPCSTFFPSFLLRRAQLCAIPCSSSVGLGHFVLKYSPVIILACFSLNTALEEEGAQHLSPAASDLQSQCPPGGVSAALVPGSSSHNHAPAHIAPQLQVGSPRGEKHPGLGKALPAMRLLRLCDRDPDGLALV